MEPREDSLQAGNIPVRPKLIYLDQAEWLRVIENFFNPNWNSSMLEDNLRWLSFVYYATKGQILWKPYKIYKDYYRVLDIWCRQFRHTPTFDNIQQVILLDMARKAYEAKRKRNKTVRL